MDKRYLTPTLKEQYLRDGFVVIKEVFTPAEMEWLKQEQTSVWLELIKQHRVVQQADNPVISLFPEIHETSRMSPDIFRFMTDSRVFDILHEVLCEEGLIVGNTYFTKPPGAPSLRLHQDNYDVGASPGTSCALWISVDHSHQANGALHFIPGSHKYGFIHIDVPYTQIADHLSRQVKEKFGEDKRFEVVAVDTFPGDVIVLNGDVVHGSYDNATTKEFRRAFALQCAGVSAERIFMYNDSLVNRQGQTEYRKLNKNHIRTRESIYR